MSQKYPTWKVSTLGVLTIISTGVSIGIWNRYQTYATIPFVVSAVITAILFVLTGICMVRAMRKVPS
jgi:asparagine N-glycosylation enzyme membrane subunit Stt3